MRLHDTIRRAGRSLKQAKARTLLTSLAIAVGAFTITLALAAGEGGRQYTEEIVSANTDVNELYVQRAVDETADPTAPKEYSDDPSVNYGGGFSMELLTKEDVEKFAELEGVESVTPYYNLTVKYITRAGEKKYTTGVETYHPAVTIEYLAGSDENIEDNGVILPETISEVLGFDNPEQAIGQTIQLVVDVPAGDNQLSKQEKTYELNVVGISKASALAVADGSGSARVHRDVAEMIYTDINQGSSMAESYMAAMVRVEDDQDPAKTKEKIESMGDYTAQTAEDLLSFMFQFINVLQGILIGFGALAVLTAVFGIINTQYISVLERTQQIGLMKALGMRRREVGRLFKIEAAWVGFIGGALGSLGAAATGVAANPWISDTLALGDTRLLIFSPVSIAIVVIGLMLVSILAGILPARKAARLDPIEALRTE